MQTWAAPRRRRKRMTAPGGAPAGDGRQESGPVDGDHRRLATEHLGSAGPGLRDAGRRIAGIAAAGMARTAGIERVGRAAAGFDDTTRRNAAVVGQSAAAAQRCATRPGRWRGWSGSSRWTSGLDSRMPPPPRRHCSPRLDPRVQCRCAGSARGRARAFSPSVSSGSDSTAPSASATWRPSRTSPRSICGSVRCSAHISTA